MKKVIPIDELLFVIEGKWGCFAISSFMNVGWNFDSEDLIISLTMTEEEFVDSLTNLDSYEEQTIDNFFNAIEKCRHGCPQPQIMCRPEFLFFMKLAKLLPLELTL